VLHDDGLDLGLGEAHVGSASCLIKTRELVIVGSAFVEFSKR
jgi:hypothetical protein